MFIFFLVGRTTHFCIIYKYELFFKNPTILLWINKRIDFYSFQKKLYSNTMEIHLVILFLPDHFLSQLFILFFEKNGDFTQPLGHIILDILHFDFMFKPPPVFGDSQKSGLTISRNIHFSVYFIYLDGFEKVFIQTTVCRRKKYTI